MSVFWKRCHHDDDVCFNAVGHQNLSLSCQINSIRHVCLQLQSMLCLLLNNAMCHACRRWELWIQGHCFGACTCDCPAARICPGGLCSASAAPVQAGAGQQHGSGDQQAWSQCSLWPESPSGRIQPALYAAVVIFLPAADRCEDQDPTSEAMLIQSPKHCYCLQALLRHEARQTTRRCRADPALLLPSQRALGTLYGAMDSDSVVQLLRAITAFHLVCHDASYGHLLTELRESGRR